MQRKHDAGETLTQSYCDETLGLCVASNAWDIVLTILSIMKSQSIPQLKSTYTTCLQMCCDASNGKSALEILKTMKQANVSPDLHDVKLAVMSLCKQGSWSEGVGLLETSLNMKEEDETLLGVYHSVLFVMLSRNELDRAEDLLLSMEDKGVMPTIYTYELVITSLLKKSTRNYRRSLKLLEHMEQKTSSQMQPNTAIYNAIISTSIKIKDVSTAMSVFQNMKAKPDIITYNSLMSVVANTGQWKFALKLLDDVNRAPGITPDIITYTNAMRAYARGKNIQRALSLLDVVKDKGMKLDAYFYTAAIDACAKGNMWRKALSLLDEMRQSGIEPTGFTYSAAISACGNGGQWERGLELLYQMRGKGMEINVITYNAAIAALANTAKKRTSTKTTKRISKDVEESSSSNDGDREEELWKHALDLLEQMKKDGVVPDAYSYSAAISACGAEGRWEEALNLIKIMQRGGRRSRPNKIAYTAAISACGRSGEWEHAMELFNDMKKDGLQPDRVSYNALLYSLRVADKADEAYEIWNEMCGRGEDSDDRWSTPDIITLTDVLGTLDPKGKKNKQRIDDIFREAVKRGIVIREDSLDSLWEVDLSGMSFPVARAACRFIFNRGLQAVREGEAVEDVTLITGVGVSHRNAPGGQGRGNDEQDRSSGATALREYIRQILRDDFDPPIYCSVPQYAAGTVVASKEIMQKWIDQQNVE